MKRNAQAVVVYDQDRIVSEFTPITIEMICNLGHVGTPDSNLGISWRRTADLGPLGRTKHGISRQIQLA